MFMNVLRNSVYKKNTRLPGVVSAFFNLALPIITNQGVCFNTDVHINVVVVRSIL